MDTEHVTFLDRVRHGFTSASESAFENPALLGAYLLAGLTIFWIGQGNTYGIVSSLVSLAITLAVAKHYARPRR
ncbi:hypothetical protein [Streptomyces sp. NPDC088725]|uniref:hypothetical protein n=1 Tax=Streptomyces sp. NPDC088725 TaxID=3365873 RepID=UPI003803D663